MTYEQFLFMRLAEEFTEAAKDALKCARFGGKHKYNDISNSLRLFREMSDCYMVVEELNKEGVYEEEITEGLTHSTSALRVRLKLRREYESIHINKEDPSIVGLD